MAIVCDICSLGATNPMKASCGHIFCWPCMYQMLDSPAPGFGIVKPCPVCPTKIEEDNDINVDVLPSIDTCEEMELDHLDNCKDVVDNFEGLKSHSGVVPRAWSFLPKRYGSAIEDVVSNIATTNQCQDVLPSTDTYEENEWDHLDNYKDVLDNFEGLMSHSGVVPRAWSFLPKRYGNAIDELFGIKYDLVKGWMSKEVPRRP